MRARYSIKPVRDESSTITSLRAEVADLFERICDEDPWPEEFSFDPETFEVTTESLAAAMRVIRNRRINPDRSFYVDTPDPVLSSFPASPAALGSPEFLPSL